MKSLTEIEKDVLKHFCLLSGGCRVGSSGSSGNGHLTARMKSAAKRLVDKGHMYENAIHKYCLAPAGWKVLYDEFQLTDDELETILHDEFLPNIRDAALSSLDAEEDILKGIRENRLVKVWFLLNHKEDWMIKFQEWVDVLEKELVLVHGSRLMGEKLSRLSK
jgi:hypothetical protein